MNKRTKIEIYEMENLYDINKDVSIKIGTRGNNFDENFANADLWSLLALMYNSSEWYAQNGKNQFNVYYKNLDRLQLILDMGSRENCKQKIKNLETYGYLTNSKMDIWGQKNIKTIVVNQKFEQDDIFIKIPIDIVGMIEEKVKELNIENKKSDLQTKNNLLKLYMIFEEEIMRKARKLKGKKKYDAIEDKWAKLSYKQIGRCIGTSNRNTIKRTLDYAIEIGLIEMGQEVISGGFEGCKKYNRYRLPYLLEKYKPRAKTK